jgi:hypothetical protein
VTGTFFSTTGSMAAPRSQANATSLADGRVLITGGLFWVEPADGRRGSPLAAYRTAATDALL